jgi:hypothetical protein
VSSRVDEGGEPAACVAALNQRSERSSGFWRTPPKKEKGGWGSCWELGRRPHGAGKGGPERPAEAWKWRAWQRYVTGGAGDENGGI